MLLNFNYQDFKLIKNPESILKELREIGLNICSFYNPETEQYNPSALEISISSPCIEDDWTPLYSASLTKDQVFSLIEELKILADNMPDSSVEDLEEIKQSLDF